MVDAKTTLRAPKGPGEMPRQEGVPMQRILDADFSALEQIPEFKEKITPVWKEGIIEKCKSHISRLKGAVSEEFLPNVKKPDAETLARAVRNADEGALFCCMAGTFRKDPGVSFAYYAPSISLAIESGVFNCKTSAMPFAAALELMGKEVKVIILPSHMMLAGDTYAFDPTQSLDLVTFPLQNIDSICPKRMRQEFDVSVLLSAEYNTCGRMLADRGMYVQAIREYDKALAANPEYITPLVNKGVVFNALDNPVSARECLEKALRITQRINLDHFGAWATMGVTLNALGEHEAAIYYLDEALNIDPYSVYALKVKGMALNMLGKTEDANECFEKASEISQSYKPADQLNMMRR
jgi:tetratricopeptide (TPR) repeat protein